MIATTVARYRHWKRNPARFLARILGSIDDVSVVQIGACDGERQDPIRRLLLARPGWRALLVEPFPDVHRVLRANYPDEERFTLVQAGIAETEGEMPFWFVPSEARAELDWLPGHVDQLGTFVRDDLIVELGASRAAELEPYVRSTPVPTMRLDTLFERHGVDRIDLFMVDTNGYDLVILRQFDVDRYRPKVIVFEHKHLSAAERAEALAIVGDYRVRDLGDDYFCVR